MNNFTYCNPTRIVFGKGSIAQLAERVPRDTRILLTYGGGSIKRNGVHEQIAAALRGRDVLEFGGIEPNPAYETLMQAVELVRREQVGFLLAAGGGSVIDGTKFIAAAALYEGADPWEIPRRRLAVPNALPLGVVLTLPATGSEMNSIAVISRRETEEKLAFASPAIYPQFSILDPETTFTLPTRQVRNGIVDAFIHVMEQYATYPVNAPLQDRQAEGILQTLVETGPRTLAAPRDYEARATMMWCATQALNGHLGLGVPTDFATHRIGHELTAFYGVEHAESLAPLLLALLHHQRTRKAEKLVQFARRVWGVDEADRETVIDRGLECTRAFFESLGMPTRLSQLGIDPYEAAERVRARMAERGSLFGEHGDIDAAMAAEIIREA